MDSIIGGILVIAGYSMGRLHESDRLSAAQHFILATACVALLCLMALVGCSIGEGPQLDPEKPLSPAVWTRLQANAPERMQTFWARVQLGPDGPWVSCIAVQNSRFASDPLQVKCFRDEAAE